MSGVPAYVAPFLWSYEISGIDLVRDKEIVIKNILDHGTLQAIQWMRKTYSADDITSTIAASTRSDWRKKSLALWSLVYGTDPANESRMR